MQQTSKFTGGEHVASPEELWVGLIGGVPFMLLGSALILCGLNCKTRIADSGVSSTNLLGRVDFSASWDEVQECRRSGSDYLLVAKGKSLVLPSNLANRATLVQQIQDRINPHVPPNEL